MTTVHYFNIGCEENGRLTQDMHSPDTMAIATECGLIKKPLWTVKEQKHTYLDVTENSEDVTCPACLEIITKKMCEAL